MNAEHIKFISVGETFSFRGQDLTGPACVAVGPETPSFVLDELCPIGLVASLEDLKSSTALPGYCSMHPGVRTLFLEWFTSDKTAHPAEINALFGQQLFFWIEWAVLVAGYWDERIPDYLRGLLSRLGPNPERFMLCQWVSEFLQLIMVPRSPEYYFRFWDDAVKSSAILWGQAGLSSYFGVSVNAERPLRGEIAANIATAGQRRHREFRWWQAGPGPEFRERFMRRFDQEFPGGFELRPSDPMDLPEPAPGYPPFASALALPYVAKHTATVKMAWEARHNFDHVFSEFFPGVFPDTDVHPSLRPLWNIAQECSSRP